MHADVPGLVRSKSSHCPNGRPHRVRPHRRSTTSRSRVQASNETPRLWQHKWQRVNSRTIGHPIPAIQIRRPNGAETKRFILAAGVVDGIPDGPVNARKFPKRARAAARGRRDFAQRSLALLATCERDARDVVTVRSRRSVSKRAFRSCPTVSERCRRRSAARLRSWAGPFRAPSRSGRSTARRSRWRRRRSR